MIGTSARSDFVFSHPGGDDEWRATRHDCFYHLEPIVRLDKNLWHCLAWADVPNLLLPANEAGLWRHLKGEAFTTPLLRSWTPWLDARLRAIRKLQPCNCFGCDAAGLTISDEELDKVVQQGIKDGYLTFDRAAA